MKIRGSLARNACFDVSNSQDGRSCREVSEKSIVGKCCREVLEGRVVEECWRRVL